MACGAAVLAQQVPPAIGPSPLDTLMNARLWADVPEPKDFVRETRPLSTDQLDFQPTRGTEIPRPKPRTAHELKALQDELERAAAINRARARQSPAAVTPGKGR
jgi:hypothetical protein